MTILVTHRNGHIDVFYDIVSIAVKGVRNTQVQRLVFEYAGGGNATMTVPQVARMEIIP
jgi:hypothetical protein